MRWKKHQPPVDGTLRVRNEFLWFPKTIGDETRWLETAEWEERYRIYHGYDGFEKWWETTRWVRWTNFDEVDL